MRQAAPSNVRHNASARRPLAAAIDRLPLLNAGFVTKDHPRELVELAQPDISGNAPYHFDVYRADQVRLTATQFSGGDWRWQLSDKAGQILVEAGGYLSEDKCREAVTMLQRYGSPATFAATIPLAVSIGEERS